jgi:hypothetical protein
MRDGRAGSFCFSRNEKPQFLNGSVPWLAPRGMRLGIGFFHAENGERGGLGLLFVNKII